MICARMLSQRSTVRPVVLRQAGSLSYIAPRRLCGGGGDTVLRDWGKTSFTFWQRLCRLRLRSYQGDGEHFVNCLNRSKAKALFSFQWDIVQILYVSLRNKDFRDSGAECGQTLLFESANRKDYAAQRDLTGHGDIVTNRAITEKTGQGGRHGDTGARSIFLNRTAWNVNMDVILREELRIDPKILGAGANEAISGLHRLAHDISHLAGQ